jgi:hypothetical protein
VAEHRPPNRGLERVRAAKSVPRIRSGTTRGEPLGGNSVTAITGFPDTSVFASFGLPHTLSE